MGTIYIVGTPIGNLSDLSPRAEEALRSCDFIAAEDTRVTLTLLNRFGIKKPLIRLPGMKSSVRLTTSVRPPARFSKPAGDSASAFVRSGCATSSAR